jgi:hypothetical protein
MMSNPDHLLAMRKACLALEMERGALNVTEILLENLVR